jgi:hypothetical protein
MGLVRDLCCVHELSRLLGFRLRSSKAAPFFKARGNNARLRRGRQAFGLDDFEPFRDWYFKVGKCSPKSCSSCSLSGRLTIKLVRGRGFVAFPGLETEILRLRSGQVFTPLTPIALACDRSPKVTPRTKTCPWGPRQARSVEDDNREWMCPLMYGLKPVPFSLGKASCWGRVRA